MAFSADYGEIVRQAARVGDGSICRIHDGGVVTLNVKGHTMYRHELNADKDDEATWLAAANGTGAVLVIIGNNLGIGTRGMNLLPAAMTGSLVMGIVPVHHWLRGSGVWTRWRLS